MDTFGNQARRDARRREREEHIARMDELVSSDVTLWDDDEPIATAMAEARMKQERNVCIIDRISRRSCFALLCLILVVAIAAGFGLSPGIRERDSGPTNTETVEITDDTRYATLFNAILDWKVTPRSALETEGSAQWRALQWLAYEDTDTKNIEAVRTRYALATLYYSTHDVETEGGTLRMWHDQTHWLSSYPVCLWHGVECHDEDNTMERVISLNLTSNGLGGSLPDELSMLELDIQYLDIGDNSIESTIPESLSKLKNLRRLYLGSNYFKGILPSSLSKLTLCTHLFLNNGVLIGTIPSEIGLMTQMMAMGLYGNFITGRVPSEIGNLENIFALYLDDNLLSGLVPSSIGQLTKLEDLRLRRNELTGTLPSSLRNLRGLEILYLDSNEFTGTLSGSLLTSLLVLRELYVYNNMLTGTIPVEIGSPVLLRSIYLDGNQFHGSLPDSLGYLRHLESLYVFGNNLGGTIPETFANLRKMSNLRLNANEFTGSFPAALSSLGEIETLLLNDNLLDGTIPDEGFGDWRKLTKLALHGNAFRGSIPSSLCSLTSIDLHELTSDCEGNPPEIQCTCCSQCF